MHHNGITKPFINFAVAAFIFLSGYLTKTDNDNWLKFYVRRITRVLVPYIIWTVIYSIPDIRSSGPSALVLNSAIPYPITSLIVLSVSLIFCYACTAVMGKRAGRWLGFI